MHLLERGTDGKTLRVRWHNGHVVVREIANKYSMLRPNGRECDKK